MGKKKIIRYFAAAGICNGELIGQLLVVRKNGKQISQSFTGKLYRTMAEARTDLTRLNCG